MSWSVHVDNEGKYIIILGEGPTQELDDTTLTAKQNILLILLNQEKDLYQVYTVMEATISYLLIDYTIQSKKLRDKRLFTVFR